MTAPGWKLTAGASRVRCLSCGQPCQTAWLYFEAPTTWTLAYCEPCAEALTVEAG